MNMNELVEQAYKELEDEKVETAKEVLKERIREIEQGEKILSKLKQRYEELLEKDIEEVADDY